MYRLSVSMVSAPVYCVMKSGHALTSEVVLHAAYIQNIIAATSVNRIYILRAIGDSDARSPRWGIWTWTHGTCGLLVYWGLMHQQQPGSYQGGEMMMMKSVFWWRKPEYPEETTDLRQVGGTTLFALIYRLPEIMCVRGDSDAHSSRWGIWTWKYGTTLFALIYRLPDNTLITYEPKC